MRNLIILILMILSIAVAPVMAEEQTLIHGKVMHGGFGGPVMKVTQFCGDTGIMIGGRGAWVINHALAIGGGGYGLVSDIKAPEDISKEAKENLVLEVGYGGPILEFIILSDKLVHLSVNTLIGGGGVSYLEENWRWDDRYYYDVYETDSFFVLEPSIDLELNIAKFFRVGMGISYRYVNDVELEGLKDSDISGLSGTFTFKFGRF